MSIHKFTPFISEIKIFFRSSDIESRQAEYKSDISIIKLNFTGIKELAYTLLVSEICYIFVKVCPCR